MNRSRKEVGLVVALGLVFLGLWAYPERFRIAKGQNDFLGLYSGAALVDRGQLYSQEATARFQMEAVGYTLDGVVCFTRPPFYAALLRPLAWMPYRLAYLAFQCLSLTAFFWFLWRFARELPDLPVLGVLCMPVLVNFLTGQDALLATTVAGGAVLLRRTDRPFLAGMVLSLCAIKFHIFLLVPVALLFRREWRVLQGGAAGAAVLTGLSFASAGWRWPVEYAAVLTNPVIHPGAEYSVNVRALAIGLTGQSSIPLVFAFCLPVAAVALYGLWKARDLETSIAIALLAGLLLSYHAYIQDATVLLLVLVLVGRGASSLVRGVATVLLLPPLYLLATLGAPYSSALPACLLLLLLLQSGVTRQWPFARIRSVQAS